MQQRRRVVRALGVATLLVGLLAVVALAAGGRTPLARDGTEGRGPPMVFWDYLLSTAVVLLVLGVPFIVWLVWISRSGAARRRTGRQRDLTLLAYVALSCATVVALSRIWEGEQDPRDPRPPRVEERRPEESDERRTPDFRWLPLFVAAGAAVALVAYQGARRRAALDPRSEDELLGELAALVEDTLEDLREEPDARRAVISAYARMESVLAAFGMPRLPFEAPIEYLQRLAPDLQQVPGAARLVFELTHLYERAKFSAHEINVEMKEHAIATLLELRAELLSPA